MPKATQLGHESAVSKLLPTPLQIPPLTEPGAKPTLRYFKTQCYLIGCQQGLGEGCAPVNGKARTCYLHPPGKGSQVRPKGRGGPPLLGSMLKNMTVSPTHPMKRQSPTTVQSNTIALFVFSRRALCEPRAGPGQLICDRILRIKSSLVLVHCRCQPPHKLISHRTTVMLQLPVSPQTEMGATHSQG